jgi:predicted PurR-regulated permease PerM
LIVQAPVHRVYAWWSRPENLPRVFTGLQAVEPLGPDTYCWSFAEEGAAVVALHVKLASDLPQRELVWELDTPEPLALHLEFEALSHGRTRLVLTLEGPAQHLPPGLGPSLPLALPLFDQAIVQAGALAEPVEDGAYRPFFFKGMAATAGALMIGALAWSLVTLIEVWVIVLGALLVAAALGPVVDHLMRWRVPRPAAVGITFLGVSAAATVLLAVLVPQVMVQGQDLAASLPAYVDHLQDQLTRLHRKHPVVPEGSRLFGYLAETGSQVLTNAFGITGKFVWLTIVFLSILFLAFFMLLDGRLLQDTVVRLIPMRKRSQFPALLRLVERRVGGYMMGLGIICVVAGVLTWACLALLGLPYALLVGAVTALLQAIPFVGPLVGAALAGLIGLSISGKLALWALLVYTAIQQLIGQILFPWIMGRTIGMHPVWVAVVLLVGGTMYGLTGAFLAIPVAIAVSIVLECYYLPWAEAQFSDESSGSPTTSARRA